LNLLKVVILVVFGIYIAGGLIIYLFQERFIFLPKTLAADFKYSFDRPFEEIWYSMEDGAQINALHFKADKPKGIILYNHGNADNLVRWGEVSYFFLDQGYDVLIYDYRGYGKSKGERSEKALFDDVLAIYDTINKKWSSDKIIIFGRSLGSGMASYLAAKRPHKMLILETPFHSLADMARYYFPIYPNTILKYHFTNSIHLKQVTNDISIFHGTEDVIVPLKSGKKLYDEIEVDHAQIIIIDGGEHNNLLKFEKYRNEMSAILAD